MRPIFASAKSLGISHFSAQNRWSHSWLQAFVQMSPSQEAPLDSPIYIPLQRARPCPDLPSLAPTAECDFYLPYEHQEGNGIFVHQFLQHLRHGGTEWSLISASTVLSCIPPTAALACDV